MSALYASPTPRLTQALGVQRRVIGALLMREVVTRFGRHNLGLLWFAGEPMLFTLGVATLWTLAGMHHTSGMPIVAFAVTGYSSVLMWRNCTSRCSCGLQQNLNLLYHRNVLAIDVFLARILLEIAGATVSFIVLSGFFIGIGWITPPVDISLVLAGWLLLAWFAVGLAMTVGSLTAWSPLVDRLWHPMSYVLFPLSGAAFMVDWLPVKLQDLVLLLPMVHGVEILRQGYFGHVVRSHYSLSYVTSACLLLTASGLWLAREAGRRVEPE